MVLALVNLFSEERIRLDSLGVIVEESDRMSVRIGLVLEYMSGEEECIDVVILGNCVVSYMVRLVLGGYDRKFLYFPLR